MSISNTVKLAGNYIVIPAATIILIASVEKAFSALDRRIDFTGKICYTFRIPLDRISNSYGASAFPIIGAYVVTLPLGGILAKKLPFIQLNSVYFPEFNWAVIEGYLNKGL